MTDVIIAIVPAPGHEGLVAEGPLGERPALLVRFKPWGGNIPPWTDRNNFPMNYAPSEFDYALVLHAPGGPRLGMVRAMEALGVERLTQFRMDGFSAGWVEDFGTSVRVDGVPFPEGVDATPRKRAYAAAHLLHQRGLASEVLVLPVPS